MTVGYTTSRGLAQPLMPDSELRDLLTRISSLAAGRDAQLLLASGHGTVRGQPRGSSYDSRWQHLPPSGVAAEVVLQRDEDDPYDPNAVKVLTTDGHELGSVSRELAIAVAALLDDGRAATARIVDVEGSDAEARATLEIAF